MEKTFTDQLGRIVHMPWPPKRIVSLVPSQTELLHYLNLDAEVIGITKFCIHPLQWHNEKCRVGGTKNVNIAAVKQLMPDLIIANKEENDVNQIQDLSNFFPVWISDIKNLNDALQMIHSIGQMTDRAIQSNFLVNEIELKFAQNFATSQTKVAYLIWDNPIMTVNSETFIHDMIWRCGWINVFGHLSQSRYPIISEDELVQACPDVLLLSSEPYPFAEKHMAHFSKLLPTTKVVLVNGEMFSWYGSRLLKAPAYFQQLLAEVNSL